jgi:hypothetical protein
MRFREFILENDSATIPPAPEVSSLKDVLANRIKELPNDENTVEALKEIDKLLSHVGKGLKVGSIGNEISSIDDSAVQESKKTLSRLVLNIIQETGATLDQRQEFFDLWKADNLVNKELLLSKKTVTFDNVFNGYPGNPIIKEFVDEIMPLQDVLGMGRGEFGLNVLSKSITVAGKKSKEDNDEDGGSKKGDLQIKIDGKTYQIELKTEMGGAGRFGDQEVRPAEGYESAAIELNKFVKNHPVYATSGVKIKKYGLNLNQAIEFNQALPPKDKPEFLTLVKKCVFLIFGGNNRGTREEYASLLTENLDAIMSAIESGAGGRAAQKWSEANFNYYMSKKHDDGVLYLNLNTNSFIYYQFAEDLMANGLRFQARTFYISATNDPVRSAYPQIGVQRTSFGRDAATSKLKKLSKEKKKITELEFYSKMESWARHLAINKGVTDPTTISNIADSAIELFYDNIPTEQIISTLEQQYPELQPKIKQPTAAPAPTAALPVSTTPITPAPAVPATEGPPEESVEQQRQKLGHLRQGPEEEAEPREPPMPGGFFAKYGYPQKIKESDDQILAMIRKF